MIEKDLEKRPMSLRQFHQRIVKREEELGMKKEKSAPLIQKGLSLSRTRTRTPRQKKRPDQSLFPHVM